MFYILKMGEGQLTAHEIPLYPTENYINGKLFDKNMKFGILVVHDVTNDITYDAKLKRSKNFYFMGKIVKILWKKITTNGKIFVVSIFVDILV